MSTKDFKRGMEAGAKPFYEKFNEVSEVTKKIGKEINTKIDSLDEVVDVIIDDLTSMKKKEIYDLNTKLDINECLDNEEKELLSALLINISNLWATNNSYQQKFIRSVNSYIGVKNPQVSIDLSSIENIENLNSQKAIFQVITEYLFLEYGDFEFLQNEEYEKNLFEYFNINKRGIKEIIECIKVIYNATGFEGIAEKYGYVVEEEIVDSSISNEVEKTFITYDGSDISEECADQVNINQYVTLDNYLVYQSDEGEFFKVKKSDGCKEKIGVCIEKYKTEDIFGKGKYLCIKSQGESWGKNNISIIDIESLKKTEISIVGRISKCDCNEENLFYTIEVDNIERMYIYNFKNDTSKILEVIVDNENILTFEKFFVNENIIYFTPSYSDLISEKNRLMENTLYLYKILENTIERLCEIPFESNYFLERCVLEWSQTNMKNNYLYSISRYDKEYAYIALDNPKAIKCSKIPFSSYSDIYTFIGYGVIYYVILDSDFSINKYDIETGEIKVILESTGCGIIGERKAGLFKKETFYAIAWEKPQVVGNWIYYRGNTSRNILKVSVDAVNGKSTLVDV
ncbi:hypothetical protein [Clostridium nigeriense]|uniref:hypothetical protein n=1 Tax=Clostridium nigeriense TaxID=1805470 RepID=UPI00082CFFF0|nr:hypothetical protein [Clostridium nigeriense]